MKQKDLVYLVLAVIILLVAGYVVYANLVPKSTTDNGVEVDRIGDISSEVNKEGILLLTDKTKAKDFSSPVEFSGLNNTAPFGK
jgi:hypothetical protein